MAELRGTLGRKGATSLAANRLRNQEMQTQSGQSGKVTSVLIGDDGKYYAVVDFGRDLGSHQVPISSVSYERNRFIVRESDVGALPSFVEGQKGMRLAEPGAAIDIPGYRMSEMDESVIYVQSAAPEVTVQRPALEINWQQPPPEVTVHQPTPHVNVRQLQPVITVRQPPPKITVEMEQPEIIVRMPDPEVDVSMSEPEVQVNLPQPHVHVVQADQPQVRVSAGEPLVSLAPRPAADVAVQRDQPQVRYERIGEPQITFRQVDGGPRVRFEEMTRDDATRFATTTTARSTTVPTMRTMDASELEGRKVYGSDGDDIGTVHRVLVGQGDQLFLVVERGGFLGFAAQRILLPASSFAMRGDRLCIPTMTAADARRLEVWDERMEMFTAASPRRSIRLGLWS